jgi:hypothetical protein
MRLENLYPNFGRSSPEDQLAYIIEYRTRRAKDLETIPSTTKATSSSKSDKIVLTDEEKLIMKMLNLKQRDVIALRGATSDIESEDIQGDLFKDTTYDEEEE